MFAIFYVFKRKITFISPSLVMQTHQRMPSLRMFVSLCPVFYKVMTMIMITITGSTVLELLRNYC